MGYNQSKEQKDNSVTINQTIANNQEKVESKLNTVGIILLIIMALLVSIFIWRCCRQSKKGVKSWLRRQILVSNVCPPPTIKVEQQQQTPKVIFS